MADHTLACPKFRQASFSQVSLPSSPSCGTVWKTQSCSPVRASKPRTSPGVEYSSGGSPCQSTMPAPTTTTPRQTMGGEVTQ